MSNILSDDLIEEVSAGYRITVNFDPMTARKIGKEALNNELAKLRADDVPFNRDKRNGIICIKPTMDFQMQYNYLKYLYSQRHEWNELVNNTCYLDMGLIPYIMFPSFMEDIQVIDWMRKAVFQANVELITLPSITFLAKSYGNVSKDSWIFREDLPKVCDTLFNMLNANLGGTLKREDYFKEITSDLATCNMSNFFKGTTDLMNDIMGMVTLNTRKKRGK